MKRTNVEAEKNELILQNEAGDYAIIPANKRNEVLKLMKEGCYDCIDSIVASLPKASDYAQDGSVMSNDPIYAGGTFPTTNVTEQAPNWLKFKREYEQSNPFDIEGYVNERFNNPRGRQAIDKINEQQFRQDLYNEAVQVRNKNLNTYVADKLLQTIPQNKQNRSEYLNQFSDKEQQIIKNTYPKYSPSLITDTKRGLTSLVESNPYQAFTNIINSKDYTDAEKREMLQDYINHPVMSKIGDAAKILSPLIIPSKMVQAAYKDNYTMQDAIQGTKNDAGLLEDIVTDPLNLVGLGIWSNLSKTGKFSKLEDAYQAVKGLSKEEAISKLSSSVDDVSRGLGNYNKILDKGLDIHDVRLKYHNNMILDFDEMDMLNQFGKGNKKNYEKALVEDIAGKMHVDDAKPVINQNTSKSNIIDIMMGTEQPKVNVPNKSILPKTDISNINPAQLFEQEQNIKIPPKFEVPSFYSAPYQRTQTSRAADKWLEDWFYNPETKKKFIDYGGTETEWENVLNSLENPIKSNYLWGKNQPGGVYIKPFDQASIPLNATEDIGVHEGIHKAKLLSDKNNPVLHRLWNDFTDAVRLTPSEAYPEIFRFRNKLGLKPGQTIDLKTMEDNLHLISDGYSLPYKIKDKSKLLEIINKAPAILPFIGGAGALESTSQTENNKIKAEDGLVISNDPPTDVRKKLLDTIGQLESSNQYDVLYGGKRNPDLLNMTIGQVIEYQTNLVNEQKKLKQTNPKQKVGSAAGRYQFIPDTLNDLVRQRVISLNDKFTPELQDKMATRLLKNRGLDKYLQGQMTEEEFADSLSMEWASLPYNTDMSYYNKTGTNKSLISRTKFMQDVFGKQQQVASKPTQQQEVEEEIITQPTTPPTQISGQGINQPTSFLNMPNVKVIDFNAPTNYNALMMPSVSNTPVTQGKLNLPKEELFALKSRFMSQGYLPSDDFLDVDILKVAMLDNVGKLGKFDSYPMDDDSMQKLVNTLKDIK